MLSRKPLIHNDIFSPRPGLEQETYGLTDCIAPKTLFYVGRRLPQQFVTNSYPTPPIKHSSYPLTCNDQQEWVLWVEVWVEMKNAPKWAYSLKHWRKERDSNPRYR
jgi:hypothetical protein